MRKPVIKPRESCIACGNCIAVAPSVFKLGADGKAEIIPLPDYKKDVAFIDRAIKECPVNIISWK